MLFFIHSASSALAYFDLSRLSWISAHRRQRGFSPPPVFSWQPPLKPICYSSYMLFSIIYVVLLRPCSRYPESLVSPFASLYFLVTFAFSGTPSSSRSNHCIPIARYFVSRPSLYVLYYLARLDSGCVSDVNKRSS